MYQTPPWQAQLDKEKQEDERGKTCSFQPFAIQSWVGAGECLLSAGIAERGPGNAGPRGLGRSPWPHGGDPDTLPGEADASWSSDLHPGVGPDLHSAGALRHRPLHSFDDILQARPANLLGEDKSPAECLQAGLARVLGCGGCAKGSRSARPGSLMSHLSLLAAVGVSLGQR